MKIKLTKNKICIVDDIDYENLIKYKWCAAKAGKNIFYAVRGGRRLIYMHHEITGKKKGMVVDHINGNTLDNRRSNLQIVSYSVNNRKSKNRVNNKSGYRGVYLHSRNNKWIAQIRLNNKSHYLGSFDDIKEAAKAFNDAVKIHYKKFFILNNI